jgi:hypothetical protein
MKPIFAAAVLVSSVLAVVPAQAQTRSGEPTTVNNQDCNIQLVYRPKGSPVVPFCR